MCGIVGYTGARSAAPFLVQGLERLEYRGYDSAGIALAARGQLKVHKAVGRVANTAALLPSVLPATTGIAHTRWATHGGVTRDNAHPHLDASGRIAVVHNGIIDNATHVRKRLSESGVMLRSETDTEVLPHLIAMCYAGDPLEAVRRALLMVEGTWGLCVAFADHPGKLVVARQGSPLVIGLGTGEMFVASDTHALSPWVHRVVYLDDGDIALVQPRALATRRLADGGSRSPVPQALVRTDEDEGTGRFPHYMLKEIHDQPEVIERAIRGRLTEDGVRLACLTDRPHLRASRAVTLVACGTSFHASSVAACAMRHLARVPARAEVASEYVHADPLVERDALHVAVSQSGETFDTLAALRLVMDRGGPALGVVNVAGSSIARTAGAGLHLHAGAEISVASTKAFTAQVATLTLLAAALAKGRAEPARLEALAESLRDAPAAMRTLLDDLGDPAEGPIDVASRWIDANGYALFMGRGQSWHVAAEGALKLKELAYVPCDAYAAGEMKHGPIAMLTSGTPVVAVVPDDAHRHLALANVEEVRARGARVVLIHSEGDEEAAALADLSIPVPACDPLLSALLTTLPLQLLAYRTAVLRGCDVDKPRNLAKSVTVA